MDVAEAAALIAADPARTGIFTDFDGTLSEIVDRPQIAQAVPGAADVLGALARQYAVVAVVSGRSLDDLRGRLEPEGVVLAGAYGRHRSDRAVSPPDEMDWQPVVAQASAALGSLEGVVLERKGDGVAVHYRANPSMGPAVHDKALELAAEFGLDVLDGRLVVELVRPGPNKGDAVASIASDHDLATILVAGDDVADLEAFRWARNAPLRSVVVGVRSEEAPAELEAMSDIVVSGPRELLAFLRKLA